MAKTDDVIRAVRDKLKDALEARGHHIAEGPHYVKHKTRNLKRYNWNTQVLPTSDPKCKKVIVDYDEDKEILIYYTIVERITANAFVRNYIWAGWFKITKEHHHSEDMEYPWTMKLASLIPEKDYHVSINDSMIWEGKEFPHVKVSIGGEFGLVEDNETTDLTREVFKGIVISIKEEGEGATILSKEQNLE